MKYMSKYKKRIRKTTSQHQTQVLHCKLYKDLITIFELSKHFKKAQFVKCACDKSNSKRKMINSNNMIPFEQAHNAANKYRIESKRTK